MKLKTSSIGLCTIHNALKGIVWGSFPSGRVPRQGGFSRCILEFPIPFRNIPQEKSFPTVFLVSLQENWKPSYYQEVLTFQYWDSAPFLFNLIRSEAGMKGERSVHRRLSFANTYRNHRTKPPETVRCLKPDGYQKMLDLLLKHSYELQQRKPLAHVAWSTFCWQTCPGFPRTRGDRNIPPQKVPPGWFPPPPGTFPPWKVCMEATLSGFKRNMPLTRICSD